MKKALVAAAVVAIGVGGYWATQQQSAKVDNQVLAYIPADTPLFSAQFTPFPIKDYVDALPDAQKQYPKEMRVILESEDDPRAQFAFRVLQQYFESSLDGQRLIDTFGLPEQITSYFYTLGMLPVVKLDIANPDSFWAVLDKAEADSGMSHESKTVAGVNYRSYRLTDEGENERVDVVFAIDKGVLTVTLDTSFLEPDLLQTALGIKPVANSLADAGIVEDIFARHGFRQDGISYINHEEIVKAITTKDGNQLARQLVKIFTLMQDDPLVELREASCQKEFAGIAANWPKTVMGYSDFEIKDKHAKLGFSTVIESKNKVVIDALSQMRGFIPDYAHAVESSVFTYALGIDVNQFVPAVSRVWDDLLTPNYQCEPLAQLQSEMEGQSPAMLGMFTGMANGVKGIAVSLIDYELQDQAEQIELKSLDGIVSLAADDPATLFNMMKPFAPELANINLPADGTAIDLGNALGLPPALGVSAKMAIKGNHMVVYTGSKSEAVADSLADAALKSNGMMTMSADYAKMFTPVMNLMAMSGEPIPEEFSALKDYRTKLKVDLDVNEQGVVIDSLMMTQND